MKWLFQLRVGLSSLYAHKNNQNLVIPLVISVMSVNALKISNTFSSTVYVLQELDALLNSVLNPQNKIVIWRHFIQ